jgi:hypothetical protein
MDPGLSASQQPILASLAVTNQREFKQIQFPDDAARRGA